MKYVDWDLAKNKWLKETRDVSFEDVVAAIESGKLLTVVDHSNIKRYPNQKIFIVNIENYAYKVPFVEDDEKIFLKTIYPSRRETKKYIIDEK
ncbi:MAG: toxin [Candidatus Harrisonbacteria bacterium CG10_big_fil_rev_8_21_14_0_10_49_15]|uniref:Toxin n=1 Tax=Candidatus Harrisonbacteria bacterium CG10_big_fil_rev_8_21_14_0_10_49_15 TaxID=1974587 RepID=A0A2H0UKF6_9BACT|nr:MAG: toxin [Candidatus Harrisonbacteria bacterium CG10_big_fil_rev_8_21_14_0_10_49_15]